MAGGGDTTAVFARTGYLGFVKKSDKPDKNGGWLCVVCLFMHVVCVHACFVGVITSIQLVAVYYISSLPFMESHRSIQLGLLIKRNELHPQDINIMPRLKTMSSLLIIKTKGTAN